MSERIVEGPFYLIELPHHSNYDDRPRWLRLGVWADESGDSWTDNVHRATPWGTHAAADAYLARGGLGIDLSRAIVTEHSWLAATAPPQPPDLSDEDQIATAIAKANPPQYGRTFRGIPVTDTQPPDRARVEDGLEQYDDARFQMFLEMGSGDEDAYTAAQTAAASARQALLAHYDALLLENKEAQKDLQFVVGYCQRLQPGGSPPPGNHLTLVPWIIHETADQIAALTRRAEAAEGELEAAEQHIKILKQSALQTEAVEGGRGSVEGVVERHSQHSAPFVSLPDDWPTGTRVRVSLLPEAEAERPLSHQLSRRWRGGHEEGTVDSSTSICGRHRGS